MQRKSISKIKDATPKFKSEAEEADWLSSPAGRRASERDLEKAVLSGKVIVSGKRTMSKKDKEALRAGYLVRYRNGLDVTPTDPALLQELMDRAKAKRTEAVSLRIPVSDIEAAKKIGVQTGLGYQTVLKEIISKGLR